MAVGEGEGRMLILADLENLMFRVETGLVEQALQQLASSLHANHVQDEAGIKLPFAIVSASSHGLRTSEPGIGLLGLRINEATESQPDVATRLRVRGRVRRACG